MHSVSDNTLIQRTQSGNIDEYGELINRYQTAVFNVCYRLLGNYQEAEDSTQDAFIRAYQKLHTFDIKRPFSPWVRKIATNICLNRLQKREHKYLPLDNELNKDMTKNKTTPEEVVENNEQVNLIRQAILELPPKHRAVIEMRHYQELRYQEISETLKMPLSDVKSYLFRGRRLLAKKLKENGYSKE